MQPPQASLVKCPDCHRPVDPTFSNCPRCDARLRPPEKPIPEGWKPPDGWRKTFAVIGVVFAFFFFFTIPGWYALRAYRQWRDGDRPQPNFLIGFGIVMVAMWPIGAVLAAVSPESFQGSDSQTTLPYTFPSQPQVPHNLDLDLTGLIPCVDKLQLKAAMEEAGTTITAMQDSGTKAEAVDLGHKIERQMRGLSAYVHTAPKVVSLLEQEAASWGHFVALYEAGASRSALAAAEAEWRQSDTQAFAAADNLLAC